MFLKQKLPTFSAIEVFQFLMNNFYLNYESSNERELLLSITYGMLFVKDPAKKTINPF